MKESPIKASIDLDKDGKFYGTFDVPNPNNQSAWGVVKIPIISIKNGEGPTMLLTGGMHGDEFEGPLALQDLARSTSETNIRGQLIIIPAMNLPAINQSTRLSPIDGRDLNRCFPGDPLGTLTEKISCFVASRLLPRVEYVIDFHSGGRSLDFLPVIIMHDLKNKEQKAATYHAMTLFGGPQALILEELDGGGMFDSYCEQQGKIFLTTELAGGNYVNSHALNIAKEGLQRLLLGLEFFTTKASLPVQAERQIVYHVPSHDYYSHAETNGYFEARVNVGEKVKENQVMGYLHDLIHIEKTPRPIVSREKGTVIARRALAASTMGDCLFVLGKEVE